MHITIIEPFYTGSHKRWIEELIQFVDFDFTVLSLPGVRWKERMRKGADELAKQFTHKTDLIIATSMLDVHRFKELTNVQVPILLYFHENQFEYPVSPHSKTNHEEFEKIHIKSIKAADKVFFNSRFNLSSLRKHFNDFEGHVLPLGMNLLALDELRSSKQEVPTIVWNHRWEFDKNPEEFFKILYEVNNTHTFNLLLLGESPHVIPRCFTDAKEFFQKRILHFGKVESFEQYINLLSSAHISLTTSNHDFFGQSVIEAAYLDVYPILPNRLAYPEHFQDKSLFYKNKGEAVNKIKAAIESYSSLKVDKEIIRKYDWQQLKTPYKQILLRAAEKN